MQEEEEKRGSFLNFSLNKPLQEIQLDEPSLNRETKEDRLPEVDRMRKTTYIKMAHSHKMTEKEKETMEKYESLDYDIIENDLYKESQRNKTKKEKIIATVSNWLIFLCIGIFTGLIAACISISVEKLSHVRWHFAQEKVKEDKVVGWIGFSGMAVAYVAIAAFLVVFVAPGAGGSGIPELKSYLNGTNLQNVFTLKALIAKVIGIVFAVAGGLVCGKEGPLVHTGAVVALVLCHMPKLPKLLGWEKLKQFRNDHDKRDFASGGGAAGVAAAFGAPLGGVLFSLEEASSFWSVPLTWRVFFCGMMSTFFVNLIKSAYNGNINDINSPGLITFGKFIQSPYSLYEIPLFVLIAIVGGLLGAFFNALNFRIVRWRRDYLTGRKLYRFTEALLVAFISATILYWAPSIFNTNCQKTISANTNCQCSYESTQESFNYYCSNENSFTQLSKCDSFGDDRESIYPYECPSGYFNPLAALTFQTEETVIHYFFHDQNEFEILPLLVYLIIIFCLTQLTYGIAVPSGLFVPAILIGCSYGRIFGELMRKLDDKVYPGTYALIGATSMLGGVTRMTISMTVIILETTNNIQYLLPIMITLNVAKWVGDIFNIALYDIHVELRCIPFVEPVPPTLVNTLLAKDVMSKPVICMREKENALHVYKTLTSCSHNGFPIINENGNYVGIILRNQLTVLLKMKAYQQENLDVSEIGGTFVQSKAPVLEDFSKTMQSNIENFQNIDLSNEEIADLANHTLDIRKYMNPHPFSVHEFTSLTRVFRLYRTMGIRHLPVVNSSNYIVGIITRKELRTDFKTDLF